MKAKKEALDDAISATKAAVAEGIVPGGGLALLRCTEAVAAEEAVDGLIGHGHRYRIHRQLAFEAAGQGLCFDGGGHGRRSGFV